MGLGTKNRQSQTVALCKQHLHDKHQDKLELVKEFIVEIEGTGKSHDPNRWTQFTDIKGNKDEMLKRLDDRFEQWLNG